MEKFGPNVLGFQLATGARQWYIVGVYIAPEDTELRGVSQANMDLGILQEKKLRIASTTLSIVSVSSGAMYTPTMYHRRAPVASWNSSTLGSNFSARLSPSGAAMSALKSPVTSRSAPRGFFRIADTTAALHFSTAT